MNNSLNEGWDLFSGISRNFCLASRFLPKDTRDTNMTLYLMLKMADTIEDSNLPIEVKKECFDMYRKFLLSKKTNIQQFVSRFEEEANLTPHEKKLIANTNVILDLFGRIGIVYRRNFINDINEMTTGMEKYLEKRIITIHDQDDYCHYVAGMVGKILTDMYLFYNHINNEEHHKMLSLSNDFGLLLQKVNIIKGSKEDYLRNNKNSVNRTYIPEGLLRRHNLSLEELFNPENSEKALLVLEELTKDAKKYKQPSLEYIKQIPKKEKGIKMFSNIILLTSLKLLDKCKGNYDIFKINNEVGLTNKEKVSVLAESWYKSRYWYK